MSRTMTRRRYTILSLSHAAEAAGFATACNLEPVEPAQPATMSRRIADKVSARVEGLRNVLASISIL
jgi:hypothetical protein